MFFRIDRQGQPVKRSYLGCQQTYEDIKIKKLEGKAINPFAVERTADYAKEMVKKTTLAEKQRNAIKPLGHVRASQGAR